MGKSYRSKNLWKALVNVLNQRPVHKMDDILRLSERYFIEVVYLEKTNEYVTSAIMIRRYITQLCNYKFCEKIKCINQNGNEIKKLRVIQRIPRKLKPESFEQFEEHPWLRWFQFPG